LQVEPENIAGKGNKAEGPGLHGVPRLNQQKILQACKEHAEQYIASLFKQTADKLDDVLFDRSNNGGDDANAYLQAARELRLQRQDIGRSFLDEFTRSYKSRLNYVSHAATAAKRNGVQSSGLSLLDEQELEESLAIDGLVAKVNDRYRNELLALAQRFNQLISGANYTDEMQPLGPDTICRAFRDVLQRLAWKVEIKLIAYKIIDKNAMQGLGEFYGQLNRMMSDAGVLPDLKLGAALRPADGGPSPPSAGRLQSQGDEAAVLEDGFAGDGSQGSSASAADVYQTFQKLMNARKYGDVYGGVGGGMAAADSLPADDLLRGLTQLQQAPMLVDVGTAAHIALIKDALREQMKQSGDVRGINPAHDNTIDVIGMVFEFILDEPSIPDMVKNLLNRLQIPILKVAIVDKGFFTNKAHAARRLLNVLGHASIGWSDNSEEARQRRFEKLDYIVNRVLNEFEQDPGIFSSLLNEFTDFLAKEGEEVIEEQTAAGPEADQAAGERPERYAFEAIEARLEGMEVPAFLRNFLRGTWCNVLQHVIDNEGYDGAGWRRHEQTVDDLMRSVEPKTTADDRRKMVTSLPRLLDALRQGMALVGSTPQEMDAVVDALEPIHMACLRGEKPAMNTLGVDRVAKAAEKDGATFSEVADMIRSIQQGINQGGDHLLAGDGDAAEGGTVEKGLPETRSVLDAEQDVKDEYAAMAADMKLGTWLEFAVDDKRRRGKLAWKSVVMGEYVFVDRKYKVVAERTLPELASNLRHGRASLVRDVPMFDRALDKVINGLMAGSKAAH
jgi:hypothetical protein